MKKIAIILSFALFLCLPSLMAQTATTLGGTISDASKALIPGVMVTATNTGTGIVTTVFSNESGAYQFANLQPGTYKVTGELSGFQTQAFSNVTLGLSQQVRLNFTLTIGSVTQTVDVTTNADTLIATVSSSVGSVLPEQKLRDLPLGSRNVLDLIATTAGTGPSESDTDGNFAGGRVTAVNVTRDGFVVSNGRYAQGTFAASYVSPDLVEEVRVVTSTVDAEAGRGSGQVQMSTRSGTNQFRGSVFWTNQNSAIDATNWFNNFNNTAADWENRNQFGGRLAGPVVKNKTFFFFLVEEQRDVVKQSVIGSVLTPQARLGNFRYFTNVNNGNASSATPTVSFDGTPLPPTGLTLADLKTTGVFSVDPNRPGYDPTKFVENTLLANMPLPNNWTIGDGLNTAGYQWTRRISGQDLANGNSYDQNNRDQFNLRLDHNLNQAHKLSFVYTWERGINHTGQAGLPNWPGGYQGQNDKWPRLYNLSFVSTLSPSLLNEVRVGLRRTSIASWAPFYVGRKGADQGQPTDPVAVKAFNLLPVVNGLPVQPVTTNAGITSTNIINWGAGDGSTRGSISPLWSYADNLSWSKGKHAFKIGGEYRRDRSQGWNDSNFTPQVTFGAGAAAANFTITGLTQTNASLAANLLYDLAGSIGTIRQGAVVVDPKNPVYRSYQDGVTLKIFDYRANEFSGFFKDDWKVTPALSLNLGMHWEWFGVPYEARGLLGAPVGGSAGLCGISCGSLTNVILIGRNSANPKINIRNQDWNNWAPAVGFSYSLPWFGKDKTILRGGYGISYVGGELKNVPGGINAVAAPPGLFAGTGTLGYSTTPSTYTNLANLTLPLVIPYAALTPPPLDGTRGDSIQAFAESRVAPYIQNFNLGIQREIRRDLSVTVSYVGTKGTRLFGGVPLNVTNIYAKGPTGETLLDAFNTTLTGGNSVLFDQLLNGLTLPGAGGAVNGTTLRGSAALRNSTATRVFLANGNIGALLNYFNSNNTVVAGKGGGIIRNSGLFPESWIVTNPQFAQSTLESNPSSSTYHSLQIEVTKRMAHGFTSQTSYTWSRTIGDLEGEQGTLSPRDPSNRALDKALLSFHRTHSLTSNGTYELPFGPKKLLFANSSGWLQRLTERWQVGAIMTLVSGAPLTFSAPVSSLWQTTAGSTPMLVGDLSHGTGKVTKASNGVVYFSGWTQGADPGLNAVTVTNALNTRYTNLAIFDTQGRPVLVNPVAGQVGNLGRSVIEGPGRFTLDANLIKRVRLTEAREFEFRFDSTNILNHPLFGNPNVNIDSTTFGQITSAYDGRRFTISTRLNF